MYLDLEFWKLPCGAIEDTINPHRTFHTLEAVFDDRDSEVVRRNLVTLVISHTTPLIPYSIVSRVSHGTTLSLRAQQAASRRQDPAQKVGPEEWCFGRTVYNQGQEVDWACAV